MDIKRDLLELENLKDKTSFFDGFSTYSAVYLFTTENIKGYFKDLNLKDKSVLTICSSSDHLLNSIVLGAKDVTAFDISVFTKYYLEFKKAAIKALSFYQFINFFFDNKQNNLSYEYFNKIKKEIEDKSSLMFWNKAYEMYNFNGETLHKSPLFKNTNFKQNNFSSYNFYGTNENYNLLQEKLEEIKTDFILSDINYLSEKLNKKYDVIIMSNISDYLIQVFPNMQPIEKLRNLKKLIINQLGSNLNENGKIQLAYLYNNKFDDQNFHREIYNKEYRKKFFTQKHGISCIEFPSAHEDVETDAVLIYTKK